MLPFNSIYFLNSIKTCTFDGKLQLKTSLDYRSEMRFVSCKQSTNHFRTQMSLKYYSKECLYLYVYLFMCTFWPDGFV